MKKLILLLSIVLTSCVETTRHKAVCDYADWRVVGIQDHTKQANGHFDIMVYQVQNLKDHNEWDDIYPKQLERTYKVGDTIKPCI